MNKAFVALLSAVLAAGTLSGCGTPSEAEIAEKTAPPDHAANQVMPAHRDVNQQPTPVKIERTGAHRVKVEMTAQVTDIEIDKGVTYKAWTFNGQAPGPLIVVKEGDTIQFTLKNLDPAMPHSMDFHAVHAAPSKKFINIAPNRSKTFTYQASSPGVFMYHCGTDPVLQHIANGMHGVIIVKPKDGYPTDPQVDREFTLIQNEWYANNNLDDMTDGLPDYVVFSTKALKKGDPNTNGTTYSLKEKPLEAKVGEKIRIYVNNVGPNHVSSFHVVGTVFDDVYQDGNPDNRLRGMQTVMLPASGGAVVEFTVKEAGIYPIVTHQFHHAQKGAVALLKVTE